MLYLLLSILCSAMNSILLRLSEGRAKNRLSVLACNYVVCALLAALNAGSYAPSGVGGGLAAVLGIGVVAGILYLLTFVLFQWNIRKNGVAMSATFMKLGVLVPTAMALTLFRESPKAVQVIGIVLAVAAMILIRLEKGASSVGSTLGLLVLLLAGGVTDSTSKMYSAWGDPALKGYFLLCTFGVALVLCVGLCMWKKQGLGVWDVLFGALIGIPNYFSSHFLLLALPTVPALVAYPCVSVGTIVVVTLAGVAFFKEKLTKRQLIALGIILLALVLLNL